MSTFFVNNATINGDLKTITGNNNTINGDNNLVNGYNNIINGDYNRVYNNGNTINGDNNYVHGNKNTINGDYNKDFGNENTINSLDFKFNRKRMNQYNKGMNQYNKGMNQYNKGMNQFNKEMNQFNKEMNQFSTGIKHEMKIYENSQQIINNPIFECGARCQFGEGSTMELSTSVTLPNTIPSITNHPNGELIIKTHLPPIINHPNFPTLKSDKLKEDGSEEVSCKICLANKVNTIILDCNHACLCSNCAKVILKSNKKECPICIKQIKLGIGDLYIS